MSLHLADVAHILIALTLLILMAHLFGHLFGALRQPPVIGEILGGLLLGPTVLGAFAPGVKDSLFPASGPTASVLGGFYQLGLIFLMFLAGTELQSAGSAAENRTVVGITVFGLVLPFGAGLLLQQLVDPASLSGPKGSATSFALVFGIGIAVTSIPVISRIMLDLGILGTPFARIVLSVAVLEDLALYVMLAVVLGLVQAHSGDAFGLWDLTGVKSVPLTSVYYVAVSLLFLLLFLIFGRRLFRLLTTRRLGALERRNPTALRIVFLFVAVLCCIALGINAVFGALMAGVSVTGAADGADPAPGAGAASGDVSQTVKHFSLALFVPVYFAIVGLQLDLLHHFPVLFFVWFIVVACAVKLAGVWVGARLAGEDNRSATNLAVAMNARGGPGIVLATVTFTAGIINEEFFTVLVLLSILTSQAAGIWLDRKLVRRTDDRNEMEGEDVWSTESEAVRRP
ncbi:cation:proton antiporter [Actinoallomurus iriomotensis]|uniref:Na+/H+ antiporter n=1 Tax=Actinoallomurus iriomotensis TaxID=478107 RepID=A0A9W6RF34_9ACTN|nr:cation:proton antiporter [Actinoallomurus iriomotensis]GLY72882.1 putative Na+/H+ antiporter [Actinoallomurus iriomotensis]